MNIFGAKWTRNNHIFDSRDTLYGALMVIGFAAVFFGILELSHKRRERFNATGLIVAAAGIAGALAGLWGLISTDTVDSNLLFAAVLALGVIVAAVGIGVWRFERVSDRGSFSLSGTSIRNLAIALGVVLFGSFVAITLDSSSEDIVGFMLTVQGLRAVVFGFGAIVGVLLPVLVARSEGKRSPITKVVLRTGTSLVIVGLAFLIQSEATSRKFRAEFFAVLLLIALIVFVAGLMPLLFQARTAAHPGADRLGRMLTVLGMGLFLAAVAVRLLYMTSEEAAATRAVFNYRVSILWFIAFAVGASLVLMRTRFGSWTFAVGGNKKAAREVGVPSART